MVSSIIIIVGAVFSYLVSRYVYDMYEGEITTNGLIGYLSCQLFVAAVMLVGGNAGNAAVGGRFEAIGRLMLVAFSMLPSLLIMGVLVSGYIGHTTIGAMFFPKIHKPVHNRLGRVKSLLWEEDVPGAVKACIEEFEKYPDDVEILLDGSNLLVERGACIEALRLLEKAMNVFYENPTAWAQATYKAASIRMEQLDDKDTACMLFRKIANRLPESEVGMRARERMHGDGYVAKRPEPEKPWYLDEIKPQQERKSHEEADPFYKKRTIKPMEIVEEPDTPEPEMTNIKNEMPGMFLDDDMNKE